MRWWRAYMFGDADAERARLRGEPLDGHLTLELLHQHEATQVGAKMAGEAGSGASTVPP
jgi:hypothetical protein